MFTIFTIPKPFTGHIGTIQRNAIKSWLRLCNDIEIVMLGNDEGVSECATNERDIATYMYLHDAVELLKGKDVFLISVGGWNRVVRDKKCLSFDRIESLHFISDKLRACLLVRRKIP